MKNWKITRRIISVLIGVGLITMVSVAIAMKRPSPIIGVLRPAVIFTVNPGQTARINVVGPTESGWNTGRSRTILLGFDVYRMNETTPRSVNDNACVKYHMIERQACDVNLTPGEAASFNFTVPAEGVATQISPVFSVEDGVAPLRSTDLTPTLELLDGGRVTGLVVLPAVQQPSESTDTDRR